MTLNLPAEHARFEDETAAQTVNTANSSNGLYLEFFLCPPSPFPYPVQLTHQPVTTH